MSPTGARSARRLHTRVLLLVAASLALLWIIAGAIPSVAALTADLHPSSTAEARSSPNAVRATSSATPASHAADVTASPEEARQTEEPERQDARRSPVSAPWQERVILLSNLNGDVLRFKAQLVLAGVAELVVPQEDEHGVNQSEEEESGASDGVVETPKAAGPMADPLTRNTGATPVSPAVRFLAIPKEGESDNQRAAREAFIARQEERLTHLATGRLRLTDACLRTSVVLLGNSVGAHPHSHEILDTFAQLRREALETQVDCRFLLLLGPNEVSFLTGDFDFLNVSAGVVAGTSLTAVRQRQQQRQVLSAFANDLDAYKESYSPYGPYGRFLLGNPFVARFGDTVLSHGGITAPFAVKGVRGMNEDLLARFKTAYNHVMTGTHTDAVTRDHATFRSGLKPPSETAIPAAGAPELATREGVEEEEAAGSNGVAPQWKGAFAFLADSPLVDQSAVLAAAVQSDCRPLTEVLQRLSTSERVKVRRLVVAGDAETTAKVRAALPTASPLATPVSTLCDGALLVVAGGERAAEPLAQLHLQRAMRGAQADADPFAFTQRARYPATSRAVPVFAQRRQPVAPPRFCRTVRTAMGPAGVRREDGDTIEGAWRFAKQLNVMVLDTPAQPAAALAQGYPPPQAARRAAAEGLPDGLARTKAEVPAAAVRPARSIGQDTAGMGGADDDTFRRRMKQQQQQRRRRGASPRGDASSVPSHFGGVCVVLGVLMAALMACCLCVTRGRPQLRVSFLTSLRHDKSQ